VRSDLSFAAPIHADDANYTPTIPVRRQAAPIVGLVAIENDERSVRRNTWRRVVRIRACELSHVSSIETTDENMIGTVSRNTRSVNERLGVRREAWRYFIFRGFGDTCDTRITEPEQ